MRYSRAKLLVVLLASVIPMAGQSGVDADFVPNEVLVSDPNAGLRGIVDPEFESINDLYSWVDRRGSVWVGAIDPATGLLLEPDGRGQLVDVDAATVGQIGNGPEWVYTDVGPQFVYTGLDIETGIPYLKRGYYDGSRWVDATLAAAAGRLGPLGSTDRGDPSPIISYQGPKVGDLRPLYVRFLRDATSERMIPTTDQFSSPGTRAIPGTNAVIFTRRMPEEETPPRQVFAYDLDTETLEQLTFDAGNKIAAFMWQAPEYDDEYVFFALIGELRLGLYRYLDPDGDGSFGWTRVQIIDPPSVGDFIWSPEPFVYGEKSYIVMVTSTTNDQKTLSVPSEVWLADIDPVDPLYRRLSDDNEFNRKDPEVYFTDLGPFVYISRSDQSGPKIMRLDTGIPH